jgi:hypothetical protein
MDGLGLWCLTPFQQYFCFIVTLSFIDGGNRSTRRKPSICDKSLTNFITYSCIEYTSPWAGFEFTILVVIGTDCIGSCISNYHVITNMMIPRPAQLNKQQWLPHCLYVKIMRYMYRTQTKFTNTNLNSKIYL